MSRQVAVSVGEDYPHLFASDGQGDLEYARSPLAAQVSARHRPVLVELTDGQWARYCQVRDAYRAQVEELGRLRQAALDAGTGA